MDNAGMTHTERSLQVVRLNNKSVRTIAFAEDIRRGNKSAEQIWMPARFFGHTQTSCLRWTTNCRSSFAANCGVPPYRKRQLGSKATLSIVCSRIATASHNCGGNLSTLELT